VALKAGTQIVTWDRCYGRDGRPGPSELRDHVLAQFATNVALTLDGLPTRRAGASAIVFVGVPFTGLVKLGRFFGTFESPGITDEYLFWIDQNGQQLWARFIGTPAAQKAIDDPNDPVLAPITTSYCQFNGKMYRAALTAFDRLHVLDPQNPTLVRRVGLGAPAAPTVAPNTSGPPGPGGLRYYRIQLKVKKASGVTQLQSNLGTAVGFTPPPVNVFVTPPTSVERFTHYVVFASSDAALYYNISGDLDITTTPTFEDAHAPASYASFPVAPDEGAYNTWPSVKYLLSGVDRLIGFGAFGGADAQAGNVSTPGRVWFSPVLGTSNTDDDERVPVVLAGDTPQQNWIDVGRGIGETDRGLGGPIDGNVLVFQSRGIYLLVPTGNVLAPFKRVTISTDVGAIEGSIFAGQDEMGRPCVMWLDETAGPYRYGAAGLQWLGFDVQDEWAKFNRTAPEFSRAHGVYHNDTHTARFWICQGTTIGIGTPNRGLTFHSRFGKDTGPTGVRFGWTVDDGTWAAAGHSVMARRSATGLGAAATAVFQPIVTTGATLLIRDVTQTTDAGHAYFATLRSKVLDLGGAEFQVKQLVTDWLYLQADRAPTDLRVALYRNFLDQAPITADRTLAPPLQSAESKVLIRYEGLLVQDAYVLQLELSDVPLTVAGANWDLDLVSLPIEVRSQERWNTSA
jgi:hypothetical protein